MNRKFILTTDASGGALNYILGQKDQNDKEYVISYGGRAVRSEEKNWNTTELECLAVVSGIETFKHYLSHRRFIVRTDHESLKWLLNKKEPTAFSGGKVFSGLSSDPPNPNTQKTRQHMITSFIFKKKTQSSYQSITRYPTCQ